MFELFIKFARYLFVLYILIFIYNTVVFMLDEFSLTKKEHSKTVLGGRIAIAINHLTAFMILAFDKNTGSFDKDMLVMCILGLMFITAANHLANYFFRNSCPIIWNCVFFLLDIGLIMLERLDTTLAFKQFVWIIFGFFIAFWIPTIINIIPKFEMFEKLYIISGYMLILLTFILGRKEYGSINWIHIGPFGFQPSEIVKFLFIFYLASVFRKRVELRELIITGLLSAGVVILLVFQKDLGSALIFFFTYIIMLYIATSNEILFFGGMAGAGAASIIAYNMFNHVRVRVAVWKDPWSDIDFTGYQIAQSLFAISTGGILGSGLTKGMPASIPVVAKDFIFAAILEEFGTIFGICVIIIFVLLFARGMIIAFYSQRRYYAILASGFTAMMAFQTFLIIGGVIKLIPLTGVTVPFVSYGGSSVVVSIITIGIIQWICGYQQTLVKGGGWNDEK